METSEEELENHHRKQQTNVDSPSEEEEIINTNILMRVFGGGMEACLACCRDCGSWTRASSGRVYTATRVRDAACRFVEH